MNYDTLIIDAPWMSKKSYEVPYDLTSTWGERTTMIHIFFKTYFHLKQKFNPSNIIFTWESNGSWRRDLLSTYKPPNPKSKTFLKQLTDIQTILYLLNHEQYHSMTNEADDVIATLASILNGNKLIYTIDKDIMQTINDYTHIYNGKTIITESDVIKKFNVKPSQIPDFLAIKGDTSDNINGIKGYGDKKTGDILNTYQSIESIPNDHELHQHLSTLKLNKKLTTLNNQCSLHPLKFNDSTTINQILSRYELDNLKAKFNKKAINEFY